MIGESLCAPQPSIRRADRPGYSKHRAIAFQHDESGLLIRQPTQSCKRHESIRADYDETAETVADTSEAATPGRSLRAEALNY